MFFVESAASQQRGVRGVRRGGVGRILWSLKWRSGDDVLIRWWGTVLDKCINYYLMQGIDTLHNFAKRAHLMDRHLPRYVFLKRLLCAMLYKHL